MHSLPSSNGALEQSQQSFTWCYCIMSSQFAFVFDAMTDLQCLRDKMSTGGFVLYFPIDSVVEMLLQVVRTEERNIN